MAYLLDSDYVIDHLADIEDVVALVASLAPEGIAISIVTYMEAYQGTLRAVDAQAAQDKLDQFVVAVPVVPFSRGVARRCATIRERLNQQQRRVRQRALDLIIAATAIEHSLTLVTRNRDDYDDIPDLSLFPPKQLPRS